MSNCAIKSKSKIAAIKPKLAGSGIPELKNRVIDYDVIKPS